MHQPSSQVAAVGKGVILGDDDCLGCAATLGQASMSLPLPGINDLEGTSLSKDLPPVIDAHVHLFPPKLFDAIWRWFDVHGWPIRYKLNSEAVVQFVVERGVKQKVMPGCGPCGKPYGCREISLRSMPLRDMKLPSA